MKKISFSRKSILRAIHAACVALFLLAAQREAQAQVAYTVPFTGSGTTYSATTAGSYSGAYGFSASGSGYSLTVGTGVAVTNTSSTGYTGTGTIASPYAAVSLGGGTVTNQGSISISLSSSGSYHAALTLGSAGSATVNNYGTISGTYAGTSSAYLIGVDFNSTTGNSLTLTNNSGAVISGSAPGNSYGVVANTTGSGTVSITNSGTLSGTTNTNGGYGIGIEGTTTTGQITVTNSGTGSITGTGEYRGIGIDVTSTTGNISITNQDSATVSAQTLGSFSAYYGIGIRAVTTSGTITINNTASISGSGYGPGYGIQATVNGAGTVNITNTGTIQGISTGTIGGAGFGIDVNTSGSGAVTVNNSGPVSASGYGTSSGILVSSSGTGSINITNTSPGTISASSSSSGANDIAVTGSVSNEVTVFNSAALSVASPGPGSAIYANLAAGDIVVNNSGATSLAGGGNAGINLITGAGNVIITNTSGGTISGSGLGGAAGIFAFTSNGTIQINNGAAINLGVTGGGTAIGIEAEANSTSITNSGSITANDTGEGNALAILGSSSSGPLSIVNSGTLTSSASAGYNSYGIIAATAGTVIDTGNITAGTYAIQVQDGSSVTLAARPIITGTISGGSSSASTSQLIFNLSIPAANLAAARTQLDGEIVDYADQGGGNYNFIIDGLTYDVSDFDYSGGVIDDLIALVNRLYRNTPGFYSEGLVLDTLPSGNAQASKLLNALGNVSDAGLVNALAELSPKTLEIFSNVANNVATFNAATINNHLANQRDGLTGFDATALNVQDSGMDPTLNQVRDHLFAYDPAATPGLISDSGSLFGLEEPKDIKDTRVNTMPTDRWSSFIAGDVILADLSHNANLEDANYTTGDVTAGVDYRLDDHFTAGALFAYSHSDASLDSRGSSATVDSYSPGLYASYVDKGWYGNGLATYGRNSYTSDRVVNIPGLGGDNHGGTSGNQGTINLTGGYEFQNGAFKFGPVASVQYVHLSLDSMQEEGPTALTIAAQDEDSFRSQLGVEGRFVANVNTPVGPVSLTPHVSLSWQHEYLDDSRGINAQFTGTGGGSFVTQTDNPDRDAAFIDGGLDATVSKNVTIFVDYETQAGQQNYFAQSAQGGVKIGF